jgi:solute:Na+ symporter, SSS family
MSYIDMAVLLIYFGAMASLGPYFARKSKTTEGYFLGDRSFPGWLVGFSMFATSISSMTFMAYPGDAYKTAYLRMVPNLTLPIIVLMASRLFLPFFRRGKITSAYEYLEGRFGPNVRLYAASAFIIGQVIRISMILFLVSQLVKEVTGLAPIYSVVVGGGVTAMYTISGGIRAVLWTDFIQAMVLWFGGIVCIFAIAIQLGGPFEGLGVIITEGWEAGKFAIAEYTDGVPKAVPLVVGEATGTRFGFLDTIGLTQKTVLLMLLLGMGNWVYEYTGNQNVIQRYAAAKSPKDARIALWICCWFSVPTWGLFMFIGTALYVFYQHAPTPESIAMLDGTAKAEGILPYFVVNELPAGVSGLVIAAVLSAAMSSISSSINGVSAVGIVDIYRRRMVTDREDRHYLVVARMIGIVQAVIMIVGAMILVTVETKTLQDTATIITSLTAGGLAGVYLLGFLTTRCDGRAVFVAIGCTLSYTLWMTLTSMNILPEAIQAPIDTYYAGLLGHIMLFMIGYVVGLIWSRKKAVPANLSVWTQDGTPMD